MSSEQSQWQWDAARQKYYVYSHEEACYLYQDGTRVRIARTEDLPSRPRTQRVSGSDLSTTTTSHSRSAGSGDYTIDARLSEGVQRINLGQDQHQSSTGEISYNARSSAQSLYTGSTTYGADQQGDNAHAVYARPSVYYDYSQSASDHNPSSATSSTLRSASFLGTYAPTTSNTYPYVESSSQAAQRATQAQASSSQPLVFANVLTPPNYRPQDITDADLVRDGHYACGFLHSAADVKILDPGYQIRKPGYKFFVVGKVFKALWPEPAGDTATIRTGGTTRIQPVTRDAEFGEPIHVKVRWFIVVKEGNNFSTCVPIQTYGKQGCTKPGIVKWQHGIAFSGDVPPTTLPLEDGMLNPVRVTRSNKQEPLLHKLSRINYGKMYTVEHRCKVYDFGNVHKNHINLLVGNWRYVLQNETYQGQIAAVTAEPTQEVVGEDEGEEDD